VSERERERERESRDADANAVGAPLVSDMRSFATLADEKPINISRTIGPWIENVR
jgi:hypothetical protein